MADQLVNGRRALLQCLDSLLAEEKNIKLYKETFQDNMELDPMKFFKEYIMPLMPKDSLAMTGPEDDKNGQVIINFQPVSPKLKE